MLSYDNRYQVDRLRTHETEKTLSVDVSDALNTDAQFYSNWQFGGWGSSLVSSTRTNALNQSVQSIYCLAPLLYEA
jgi:hypothetical protein